MNKTFATEINKILKKNIKKNKNFYVGGQLVRYGVAGLTKGLYPKFKNQIITYPVSESLMNSSVMGMALAGKKVVLIHVRIDFLASGMCALVNHLPIWYKKGYKLPVTLICQIGRGMGQGPQHSKDLTSWFKNFEGWEVNIPYSPSEAASLLQKSINSNKPTLYIIHRELFNEKKRKKINIPNKVFLCGASKRHEKLFYDRRDKK
jgi:pyruvate/2-oxoglutarate/acetoin dehydrogenase E1 component